jgi:hypothetical protein
MMSSRALGEAATNGRGSNPSAFSQERQARIWVSNVSSVSAVTSCEMCLRDAWCKAMLDA